MPAEPVIVSTQAQFLGYLFGICNGIVGEIRDITPSGVFVVILEDIHVIGDGDHLEMLIQVPGNLAGNRGDFPVQAALDTVGVLVDVTGNGGGLRGGAVTGFPVRLGGVSNIAAGGGIVVLRVIDLEVHHQVLSNVHLQGAPQRETVLAVGVAYPRRDRFRVTVCLFPAARKTAAQVGRQGAPHGAFDKEVLVFSRAGLDITVGFFFIRRVGEILNYATRCIASEQGPLGAAQYFHPVHVKHLLADAVHRGYVGIIKVHGHGCFQRVNEVVL